MVTNVICWGRGVSRALVAAAALLGLCLSASTLAATRERAHSEAEIKQACQQLVLDYASFRDQRRGEDFANLFTVDGELALNGDTFVGRKALASRLSGDSRQRSRHLMTNIRVTIEDANHAHGISYALIFIANEAAEVTAGPAAVVNFTAMGEYHDEFIRTEQGWRIATRRFVPVFVPQ